MDPSDFTGERISIGGTDYWIDDVFDETGREGVIYEVMESNSILVKVFREEVRDNKMDKLRQMMDDDPSREDRDDPPLAWPQNLASHDGRQIGYSMTYIAEAQNAEDYARKTLRWDESELNDRYKPAVNLTLVLALLHDSGYAVGDLSAKNVLIKDGFVSLVDVDSYSIEAGSEHTVGAMHTPLYTPPEGVGDTYEEVKQTDEFAAAIHIFQFLMEGYHPFQVAGSQATNEVSSQIKDNPFVYPSHVSRSLTPPPRAPDYTKLEHPIRALFERCFIFGKFDPKKRPTLSEWRWALDRVSGADIPGQLTTEPPYDWRDVDERKTVSPEGSSPSGPGADGSTGDPDDPTSWADEVRVAALDALRADPDDPTSWADIELEHVSGLVFYVLVAAAFFLFLLLFA